MTEMGKKAKVKLQEMKLGETDTSDYPGSVLVLPFETTQGNVILGISGLE